MNNVEVAKLMRQVRPKGIGADEYESVMEFIDWIRRTGAPLVAKPPEMPRPVHAQERRATADRSLPQRRSRRRRSPVSAPLAERVREMLLTGPATSKDLAATLLPEAPIRRGQVKIVNALHFLRAKKVGTRVNRDPDTQLLSGGPAYYWAVRGSPPFVNGAPA